MEKQEEANEWNGYSLFMEPECEGTRHRNRAVIMANMIEKHLGPNNKMTKLGAMGVLAYFAKIPHNEKQEAQNLLEVCLKERGISYGS